VKSFPLAEHFRGPSSDHMVVKGRERSAASFGYKHACATRTAWQALHDHGGVCRDFAHLAIAFCRCLNIPARYCTGYLGDIGVRASDLAMDFSAWFEAYLDDA
jgi:transglutaminase-like putative cysteine protease